MSSVTTDPAPIKACLPIVIPQRIVELAPMVAPLRISVGLISVLRGILDRGLMTFVKTQDGPQNTSSSRVTPS